MEIFVYQITLLISYELEVIAWLTSPMLIRAEMSSISIRVHSVNVVKSGICKILKWTDTLLKLFEHLK